MNGVTFGTYHSYDDMFLILNSKEIETPSAKTKTVEIEGGNGVLDYTEYFGETKYNNRNLKFNFSTIIEMNQFLSLFSTIQDNLHGKKMNIILDDDPNYYYVGRLSVGSWANSGRIGALEINADCEPYKLKINETTVTRSVNGTTAITLTNERKKVVPTITTTAEMTISFNGISTTASAGTFAIPTLELSAGNNVVTVSGPGTITFVYREGRL